MDTDGELNSFPDDQYRPGTVSHIILGDNSRFKHVSVMGWKGYSGDGSAEPPIYASRGTRRGSDAAIG